MYSIAAISAVKTKEKLLGSGKRIRKTQLVPLDHPPHMSRYAIREGHVGIPPFRIRSQRNAGGERRSKTAIRTGIAVTSFPRILHVGLAGPPQWKYNI
jgi:hypothetical protein